MRTSVFLAAFASLSVAAFSAKAGRLDLAVMQFSDKRDVPAMAEALHSVDLNKITDSDRTETSVAPLRGGNVIFTQSIAVPSAGSFANSTRLTNQRADVSGSINGSQLTISITILQGVKIGLRKYRQDTFAGSGSIAGGVAQLISSQQSSSKTQINIKGHGPQIVNYDFTTIIAAKYTP